MKNRIEKFIKRQGADSKVSVGVPSHPESDFGRTFQNPCRPNLLWEGKIKSDRVTLINFISKYNSGEKEKSYQIWDYFFIQNYVCFVDNKGRTLLAIETE